MAFACLLHDASECYLSDVPRPFKKTLSGYKEQEENLLDLIYQKYLGSPLNAKEKQLLKEIDDDMLWFDLTHLLNEPQEREAPEIHITIDYTVRAFEETEKEYLELYSLFYPLQKNKYLGNFGMNMPKHLAGQWCVNSNIFSTKFHKKI